MRSLPAGGSGVSPEKLLLLFLRAAAGGAQKEQRRGAAPRPRSGAQPLTTPLKLTPMGAIPCGCPGVVRPFASCVILSLTPDAVHSVATASGRL